MVRYLTNHLCKSEIKTKKNIQEYLHTKNCQKYKPVILM